MNKIELKYENVVLGSQIQCDRTHEPMEIVLFGFRRYTNGTTARHAISRIE